MIPKELPSDVRKILSRWARDDYYVYLRPMSSAYVDPALKETTYWTVNVEFRSTIWQQVRGEGYDLCEVIRSMAGQVPRRQNVQPGYMPGKHTGWLAARAAAEAEKEHLRRSKTKVERSEAGSDGMKKAKVSEPTKGKMKKKPSKKKRKRA